MSRCVPNWDVEGDHNPNTRHLKAVSLRAPKSMTSNLGVPAVDYEVAELTWKNGQVVMHGLNPPRVAYKPHANTAAVVTKYAWDNPRAAETLETIVNQATLQPHCKPHNDRLYAQELVPWLDHHTSAGASATMTMDALVPSYGTQPHAPLSGTNGDMTACSTRVGSCSSNRSAHGGGTAARELSVSGSETFGMESSRQLTVERGLGVKGLTSTSPEDSISGKRFTESASPDEHDSVCHSRLQKIEPEEKKKGKGKSSISTKRSRATATHNQAERRRRDKINQRMKTLQKLVPNANKTDKASILDEVIEYLKQLQAQIHMMGRMSISSMMMPLAAMQQQQLQMAMMNPMGMGIGMQGVMDLNAIGSNRPNIPGIMSPLFHPPAFMQPMMPSWDMQATGDHRVSNHNDPMVAFLASQSQSMTMEGYSRMAALFQQMQNQPCYSGLKN